MQLTSHILTRLLCALLLMGAGLASSWAQQNNPAQAEKSPQFDIFEFVVTGDTLLGNAAIERAVYRFMGPGRTVADAEGARKALEKAYQDAGFLSVNVVLPPQRVDLSGGEVRLEVVQGTVAKLRVTGAEFFLPSNVKEALPALAPGNVPNFNEMQQQLSELSRETADRQITPILAAGDAPGTLAVELKVKDQLPLNGSLEVSNKQSVNTQAGRIEAGLSYDNLFQAGHSLGLNWFVAPKRTADANVVTLNYQLPLGGSGDKLSLLLTHSSSNAPTAVNGATASRGDTWVLRWRDELPVREGISHGLSWGLTWRNLRDRNVDSAGSSSDAPSLRYATLNMGYDLTLEHAASPGRQSQLQADFTASLPGQARREVDCDGTLKDQFDCKRSGTSARFQTLALSFTHREPLARWQLLARLQAQLGDAPLVSAEQVSYGGQDSVRGYYEGEESGDVGAALRLELLSPAWAPAQGFSLRGVALFDRAFVHRYFASSTEKATQQLGSWGLGLRLETGFGLQATLEWSRLLTDSSRLNESGLRVPVSGRQANRQQRADFTLRQSF
jgi:hemolysin activation/secretion protein